MNKIYNYWFIIYEDLKNSNSEFTKGFLICSLCILWRFWINLYMSQNGNKIFFLSDLRHVFVLHFGMNYWYFRNASKSCSIIRMKTLNAHFQVRYLPENMQIVERRSTKCKFVIRVLVISITYKVLQSCIFLVRRVWGIMFFSILTKCFSFLDYGGKAFLVYIINRMLFNWYGCLS